GVGEGWARGGGAPGPSCAGGRRAGAELRVPGVRGGVGRGRGHASRVFAGESRGGRSPLLQRESDVRENTLRAIWARGEAVVNGWLSIPSSFSAEIMAHQGFDSLTVDMQHGVIDYQTAVTMLQAISTTPVIPLA